MYTDLRYHVRVDAQSTYVAEQSDPEEKRFVFTYTVSIHNEGTLPAQLLHRYWKITDGDGLIREVHGDGVVGEQPTIVPGDVFSYTSGAVLETAVGTMEGYFEMLAADGETFRTAIPVFSLLQPSALH
jgi:ApaG protein